VQDANSSDGTQQILKRYAAQGANIHIEADKGQTDGLNRGFARTSSEVMAYLNSDDIFLPGTLHLVGGYFRDNPAVDVIYGNRILIDEAKHEIGRWIVPRHDAGVLRFIAYIPQETMFWRRRIWERAGARFDPNLHFAMDWDLVLRFLKAGAVFAHLPELVGIFHVHGQQKHKRTIWRMAGMKFLSCVSDTMTRS
jgi:glycosyltransferase involved in cell wall biosynthesis